MTEPNRVIHHRRSIRLADYDYSAEGGYCITIVLHGDDRGGMGSLHIEDEVGQLISALHLVMSFEGVCHNARDDREGEVKIENKTPAV